MTTRQTVIITCASSPRNARFFTHSLAVFREQFQSVFFLVFFWPGQRHTVHDNPSRLSRGGGGVVIWESCRWHVLNRYVHAVAAAATARAYTYQRALTVICIGRRVSDNRILAPSGRTFRGRVDRRAYRPLLLWLPSLIHPSLMLPLRFLFCQLRISLRLFPVPPHPRQGRTGLVQALDYRLS